MSKKLYLVYSAFWRLAVPLVVNTQHAPYLL